MTGAAATALAAFNLVCTGLETSGSAADRRLSSVKQSNFTEVYRVNLELQRWCRDACTETRPLASLTDTNLTFEKSSDDALHFGVTAGVNRESGQYMSISQIGDLVTVRQGECKKTDFAGFPARKF